MIRVGRPVTKFPETELDLIGVGNAPGREGRRTNAALTANRALAAVYNASRG